MTALCPTPDAMVEERIDRVLTQYRESPKLLFLLRTYLRAVAETALRVCDLPEKFDLDTAVGDQLTLLGKRLGWPRCHCICETQPVFGFDCTGVPSGYIQSGFCDDNVTWLECGPFGQSDICINDDEIYRRFLKARRYQVLALYDIESLTEAVRELFGPQAMVLDAGKGRVVIAPNRALTESEQALLQVYPRVLPVAPGIRIRFHFGQVQDIFGFGDGWAGFCIPFGYQLVTDTGALLINEERQMVTTGSLSDITDPDWMCEVDVRPYDCAGVSS